jgi:multiple sugar transport system permease protein
MINRIIFRLIGNFILSILLTIVLIFLLFPIIWICLMSFKTPLDIISVTPKFVFRPTIQNYVDLFTTATAFGGGVRGGFWNYFRNSFIITAGAMGLTLLLGLPAAFALARFKFLGRSHIAFTFLTFRFVPELSIILPLYIIFQKIKLYNTYIGLILAYQLITLPLFVWIIRVFFDNIPRELEEAALVDGANWWHIFWQVDLPLVRGGLAAAFILCAIFAWNNFIFGLILGAQDTQPLTVGVLGFMSYEQVLWGQMAAASMLIILPKLAVVALVQRYIVQGLTLGALAHQ